MSLIDTADPTVEARADGYDWSDINSHVAESTVAATQEGYTQPEIDEHLGYQAPEVFNARAETSWAGALKEQPELLDSIRLPQNPFDLSQNTNLRQDYAAALSQNEVKGPQDFADRYAAAAINAVHPDDMPTDDASQQQRAQSMAGSTARLGAELPTREDGIDAALSLGADSKTFSSVFSNVMDHWAQTGQHPLDAAIQADQDPELFQKLAGGKEADPDVTEPGITVGSKEDPDSILSRVAKGFAQGFGKMFQEEPAPFKPEKMGKAEIGGAILGSVIGAVPGQIVKAAEAGGRALDVTMKEGLGKADPQDILNGAMLGIEMRVPGGRPIRLEESPEFQKPVEVVRPELPAGAVGASETMPLHEALAPTRPADVDKPETPTGRTQKFSLGETRTVLDATTQTSEEGRPSAAVHEHDIVNADGQRVGTITVEKLLDADGAQTGTAYVHRIEMDEHGFAAKTDNADFTTSKAGANTIGPRAVRDLARQYFEANPTIDKIEGFRSTGARRVSGNFGSEASITRDQVMGPGKRFDPEAKPAEKIEALARDAGEHTGDPEFFQKLAKDEDPATKKLAASWDFVSGLWKVFKDVFADESGAMPNPFAGSPARQLEAQTKADSFNFAYNKIRQTMGKIQEWGRHFETPDNIHKLINADVPEFQKAIRDGTNPLQTRTGDIIQRLAGFGTNVINRSSPLWPVIAHYQDVSQRLGRQMRSVIRSGAFTEDELRRKLVLSMFNETSSALDQLTRGEYVTAVSHPRTLMHEGLANGLTPREVHPIDFHEKLANQVAKIVEQGRAITASEQAGFVYRARAATAGTADREIAGTERFQPNATTGKSERTALFGDPAYARLWNRYVEGPGRLDETKLDTFVRKAQYWANQSAVLKLFLPFYHAGTMIKEAYTGQWATMGDLAARGQWTDLAKETMFLGVPGSPVVRMPMIARKAMANYYKTGVASPEMKALIDVNGLQKVRPDLYKSLSERERSIWDSVKKGSLRNEIMDDVRALWPDNGSAPATKAALLPFRGVEMAAKEIGRLYTSIPGLNAFWEKFIPYAKMGTNLQRMRYAMEADPAMAVEKRLKTARQIVDDTDNRMGEMNQDNIMWPKMVKNVLNTLFISAVSWKYGTMRLTAAGLGLNTDKFVGGLGLLRSLEWNPYATRALGAMMFSNALINSTLQWAFTGKFPTPWDDRPIMDKMKQALTPWSGALLAKGAKELMLVPGQEKEFLDWAKVWQAGLKGGPLEWIKTLGDYGIAGMKPPFSMLRDFYVGKDAIGNDIKLQTGGVQRYLKEHFGPIYQGTMGQRKAGTGIAPAGSFVGLRPAGSWWNDPANYWAGREKADARTQKEQIARERRDVGQLETPPDWAKDIPAKAPAQQRLPFGGASSGSRGGGAGFSNPGGAEPGVSRGGSRGGGSGFANPGGGGRGSGFANPGSPSPRVSNGNAFNNLRGVRSNRGNRRR